MKLPFRATTRVRPRRGRDRGTRSVARDRRDRPPRAGGYRNSVGDVPVVALAREAGGGAERGDRSKRRADEAVRQRRPRGRGRPRAVHAVDRRIRQTRDRAHRLLSPAVPGGVRAGLRGVGRDPAAREPQRSPVSVRDAAVQARGNRRGRAPREAGSRVLRGRQTEHPTRRRLPPRRRPLRGLAVLRRAEHATPHVRGAGRSPRTGVDPLRGSGDLARDAAGQHLDLAPASPRGKGRTGRPSPSFPLPILAQLMRSATGRIWPRISPPAFVRVWTFTYARPASRAARARAFSRAVPRPPFRHGPQSGTATGPATPG